MYIPFSSLSLGACLYYENMFCASWETRLHRHNDISSTQKRVTRERNKNATIQLCQALARQLYTRVRGDCSSPATLIFPNRRSTSRQVSVFKPRGSQLLHIIAPMAHLRPLLPGLRWYWYVANSDISPPLSPSPRPSFKFLPCYPNKLVVQPIQFFRNQAKCQTACPYLEVAPGTTRLTPVRRPTLSRLSRTGS